MGTVHLAVTLKLEERLVFIRRLHFFPEHFEPVRQWASSRGRNSNPAGLARIAHVV